MANSFLKLNCPACSKGLKIKRASINKSIVCPKCNSRFKYDELSNTTVIQHDDLFGPPVSSEFSQDSDPFGNVDQFIDDHARSSKRTLDDQTSDDQPAKAKPLAPSENDAVREWSKQKKVTTKFEDSLNRNGIGLLVLATGISLLPFIASNVDELQPVIPLAPMVAAGLAFIASFMLAYSLRRSNIATVLISGLPFMLIGLISLGGYYFLANQEIATINDKEAEVRKVAVDNLENGIEIIPADDGFDVDRDSITDNSTAKFVPPDHSDDTDDDSRPTLTRNNQPENESAEIKESRLRPGNVFRPSELPQNDQNEFVGEIEASQEELKNLDKLAVLNDRMQLFRHGLVSRDKIMSPKQLASDFELSHLAGRETVYGVAYIGRGEIRGFDIAHHQNQVDDWIDIVVPIIDQQEFSDSIFVRPGSSLVGLNVNTDDHGIAGIQGILTNERGNELTSSWIGVEPEDPHYDTIRSNGALIFGVVVYRNQLSLVGLRLILEKKAGN